MKKRTKMPMTTERKWKQHITLSTNTDVVITNNSSSSPGVNYTLRTLVAGEGGGEVILLTLLGAV